jgi:tetratricopeptide (TPR) repeat protein
MSGVEMHNGSSYQEFTQLLRELHLVMSRGDAESPEADAIREAMDGPWYGMTAEEQQRARGMSADLYTLESDSPIVHPNQSGIYDTALASEIRNAKDNADFDQVLHLLRDHPEKISADRAAMLRALSYERLGDIATSILFFEGAARISQEDGDSYSVFLLIKLLERGHLEDSRRWADELSKGVKEPSNQLWFMIGHVFFDSAQMDRSEEARDINLGRAADAYQRAAVLPKTSVADPRERLLVVNALLGQASTYNLLHDLDAAIQAVDTAHELDPNDDIVLTVRGLLNLGRSSGDAILDFRRAVDLHTTNVWPYYFLAHDAITHGNYADCLQLCYLALRHAPESDLPTLADLYEWTAISLAETGVEDEKVLSCFESALAAAPINERIANNLRAYRTFLDARDRSATEWGVAAVNELQDPNLAIVRLANPRLGQQASVLFSNAQFLSAA